MRGRRVRLLGPTHSELIRVDLPDVPEAQLADEVVLLGRSDGEEITLQDLSQQRDVDVSGLYPLVGKSIRREYVSWGNR